MVVDVHSIAVVAQTVFAWNGFAVGHDTIARRHDVVGRAIHVELACVELRVDFVSGAEHAVDGSHVDAVGQFAKRLADVESAVAQSADYGHDFLLSARSESRTLGFRCPAIEGVGKVGISQQASDFGAAHDAARDGVLEHLFYEENLLAESFNVQVAVIHYIYIAAVRIVAVRLDILIEVSLEDVAHFARDVVLIEIVASIFACLLVLGVLSCRSLDGLLQLDGSLVGCNKVVVVVDVLPRLNSVLVVVNQFLISHQVCILDEVHLVGNDAIAEGFERVGVVGRDAFVAGRSLIDYRTFSVGHGISVLVDSLTPQRLNEHAFVQLPADLAACQLAGRRSFF